MIFNTGKGGKLSMRDFDKQMEMVLYHSDEGELEKEATVSKMEIVQRLDEKVVVSKMEITSPHGAIPDKPQTSEAMFYNLDAIIYKEFIESIETRINESC